MPRLLHSQQGTDGQNWWDFYVDYTLTQNEALNQTTVACQSGYICKKANSGTYVGAYYQLIPVDISHAKVESWNEDLRYKQVGDTREITSTSVTLTHNADGTHDDISIRIYCKSGRVTIGTVDKTFGDIAIPTIGQKISVKDGGTWKKGTIYAKDGGTWKKGTVYAKDGGSWELGL